MERAGRGGRWASQLCVAINVRDGGSAGKTGALKRLEADHTVKLNSWQTDRQERKQEARLLRKSTARLPLFHIPPHVCHLHLHPKFIHTLLLCVLLSSTSHNIIRSFCIGFFALIQLARRHSSPSFGQRVCILPCRLSRILRLQLPLFFYFCSSTASDLRCCVSASTVASSSWYSLRV